MQDAGTGTSATMPPAGGLPATGTGSARVLLLLAVVAVGLAIYAPTFGASYAYDDIDYLNVAADQLSGRMSVGGALFRPQSEHFLPALRLLVAANARLFGIDARPWRLLVFSSHVLSALLLAGVARRYFPSSAASLAAGTTYVLAAGFSSMWVWFPSGGCVPIGLVGITGAMLALASRERLGVRRARILAAFGVLGAVAFENGLVPLVAAPALLDEWERRRSGAKRGPLGPFFAFSVALAGVAVLATSVFYTSRTGLRIEVQLLPALKRMAFLLLAAPYRFLFPGQHLPRDLGSIGGAELLAAGYGLVVLLVSGALIWRLTVARARPLLVAAALSSIGAAGFVGLVAVARVKAPAEELFDADRYFFPLLVPLALLSGAAFGSLAERAAAWPRRQRSVLWAVLGAVLLVELTLHAFAVRRRAPLGVYAAHGRRLEQLKRLGELLADRASALPRGEPPLAFPDGTFSFPDVHNGRLSARLLLYVATTHRPSRLVLGDAVVGPRDAAIVDEVLVAWARERGEPPTFRIRGGQLEDAHRPEEVRFELGPSEGAVVEGMHVWERAFRWAGPRAVLELRAGGSRLRLRLAAPVTALRAAVPGLDGPRVAVSLQDPASGAVYRLGEVRLEGDAIADHHLELPAEVASIVTGRAVRIVLEGAPVWRPRDVLPGATDERAVTVQVYEVAFEDPKPEAAGRG